MSTELYATANFCATGPEPYRREVKWIYGSTFFPGVYARQQRRFLICRDLTADAHRINPDETPVYVLVGDYDAVANDSLHGGPAIAQRVPGVQLEQVAGSGHFAPIR